MSIDFSVTSPKILKNRSKVANNIVSMELFVLDG